MFIDTLEVNYKNLEALECLDSGTLKLGLLGDMGVGGFC